MEIERNLSSTVGGKRQPQCINQNSFDNSTPIRLLSEKVKQTQYRNKHHTIIAFQVLQSLRKDGIFCDITLKTDDGTIVGAHKIVLACISPYFREIFTNFEESKKNQVPIRELNSSALILLIDFIYTAQIMITEENVKELIPAAKLLELDDVQDACCSFLQGQLQPTNCLDIMKFADNNDCTNLLSITKSYILQNFSEVVKNNKDSLYLTSEQVQSFISNNELTVSSEEKVYEYVIKWIYFDLNIRKKYLPKLMEHVRLPLISIEYVMNKVEEEPLIKNSPECKDYIIEALRYHVTKSEHTDAIPKTIRTKPRGKIPKVFITFNESSTTKAIIKWYDSITTQWHCGPEISLKLPYGYGFSVYKENAFFVGGKLSTNDSFELDDVCTLDLSLPSIVLNPLIRLKYSRYHCGVASRGNHLYAFGGMRGNRVLKSSECWNIRTKKWHKISYMPTARSNVGVGILNYRIYVVGGKGRDNTILNSVECFHYICNQWITVASMQEYRMDAGVGVLNGVVYAVGGTKSYNKNDYLNSVEAYEQSTNVWTLVAPMNKKRRKPLVMAMDGLLYVFEGNDVEMYNPVTNHWSI